MTVSTRRAPAVFTTSLMFLLKTTSHLGRAKNACNDPSLVRCIPCSYSLNSLQQKFITDLWKLTQRWSLFRWISDSLSRKIPANSFPQEDWQLFLLKKRSVGWMENSPPRRLCFFWYFPYPFINRQVYEHNVLFLCTDFLLLQVRAFLILT